MDILIHPNDGGDPAPDNGSNDGGTSYPLDFGAGNTEPLDLGAGNTEPGDGGIENTEPGDGE